MAQPQQSDAQSFFEFLAELEHLAAAFQRRMQDARATVYARHQQRGIVMRATGNYKVTPVPNVPLRLVDLETPVHPETTQEATRQPIDQAEIKESQKAMTERLRDQYWSW